MSALMTTRVAGNHIPLMRSSSADLRVRVRAGRRDNEKKLRWRIPWKRVHLVSSAIAAKGAMLAQLHGHVSPAHVLGGYDSRGFAANRVKVPHWVRDLIQPHRHILRVWRVRPHSSRMSLCMHTICIPYARSDNPLQVCILISWSGSRTPPKLEQTHACLGHIVDTAEPSYINTV